MVPKNDPAQTSLLFLRQFLTTLTRRAKDLTACLIWSQYSHSKQCARIRRPKSKKARRPPIWKWSSLTIFLMKKTLTPRILYKACKTPLAPKRDLSKTETWVHRCKTVLYRRTVDCLNPQTLQSICLRSKGQVSQILADNFPVVILNLRPQ